MKKLICALAVMSFAFSLLLQNVNAGGSSFSWKSVAEDGVLSGGNSAHLLTFSVNNYFTDERTIKLDKLRIICTGSKVVGNGSMYSKSTFKTYNAKIKTYKGFQLLTFSPGEAIPYDQTLPNDQTRDWTISLGVKTNAVVGSSAQCAVDRLKISHAATGEIIDDALDGAYGFKESNEIANIIVGTGADMPW